MGIILAIVGMTILSILTGIFVIVIEPLIEEDIKKVREVIKKWMDDNIR